MLAGRYGFQFVNKSEARLAGKVTHR